MAGVIFHLVTLLSELGKCLGVRGNMGKPWGLESSTLRKSHLDMGQNPIPMVNTKIAGKWMFIPLKMVCIGIDP
jgi:hypothetical protein